MGAELGAEMDGFAHTPAPPYYAVIFTSLRTAGDGGTELLHAVMYAERPQPAVADAFFEGIKWP